MPITQTTCPDCAELRLVIEVQAEELERLRCSHTDVGGLSTYGLDMDEETRERIWVCAHCQHVSLKKP